MRPASGAVSALALPGRMACSWRRRVHEAANHHMRLLIGAANGRDVLMRGVCFGDRRAGLPAVEAFRRRSPRQPNVAVVFG